MPREINKAGYDLIKEFEGKELVSYLCPAGVWTIGYGHTGPDVREGIYISDKRALELLEKDLDWAEDTVTKVCPVTSDNEFAALVSLCFNIGAAGFTKSTVARLHNKGDKIGAAKAFGMWNKATVGGELKPLLGLTRRRNREAELYLTPDTPVFAEQRMPQAVQPEKPTVKSTTVITGTVGTVAAGAAVVDQIVPIVQSAKTASDLLAGMEGKALVIGLGVLATVCLAIVVWRYVIKARRGDVVVS